MRAQESVANRMQIFTDGSYDGAVSAWALVIVHLYDEDVLSVEWFACRVETDSCSPG